MVSQLYTYTVPAFIKKIKMVQTLIDKADAELSDEKKADLLSIKLVDDMQGFPFQIQRISDTAKGVVMRLGKAEPVAMPDNEKSLSELKERLQKTVEVLEKADASAFDGMEGKEVMIKTGGKEIPFTSETYINDFAIPNFYFHVTMAYALLRKEKVQLGKLDFLGRPQ